MANTLFPLYKKKRLEGSIAFLTDTIKVSLIDTALYTYAGTHEFYSSAVAGLVGTAVALGTKTAATNGVADAADTTFTAVSGATVEALVIWKDTGSNATSPLIAYIDTAIGLPFTPSGSNKTVVWDLAGIFTG